MTTIRQFHHDGTPLHAGIVAAKAQAQLQRLGIQSGRWALQLHPVSSTPQLTYARQLHALQQRCGAVLTDRLRLPQRRPPAEAGWPEPEPADVHVHDDIEARVVLAGQARFVVATGEGGGWSLLDCSAGDWIVLPAGLPHALLPVEGVQLDMLRLFARPRGWIARRTDIGMPPPLVAAPLALAA